MTSEADIKELFSGASLRRLKFGEPMSAHTSLGIGGPAGVFIEPDGLDSLARIVEVSARHGLVIFPLGGGTNLLVRGGGIEGIVVSMSSLSGMEKIAEDGSTVTLDIGAGHRLQGLIGYCRKNGLSGIEGLSGIPGQVGGAIAGNAGSFGAEIKDVIRSVKLIDKDGRILILEKGEIVFGYRRASFPEDSVIAGAEIVLKKDDPSNVSEKMDGYLKEKRMRQPIGARSAGCVFKNPPSAPAGKLIEDAGLKGAKVGGIEVSMVHANFFINAGGGTADDFLRLMDMVSKSVKEKFGVVLEPEIRIVGRG